MKHISDSFSSVENKIENNSSNLDDGQLSREAIRIINELFDSLDSHVTYFRHSRMKNQDLYLASKREWAKTFQVNRMTDEKVRHGINAVRKITYEIKNMSPGEFIAMCTPSASDYGLKSTELAFKEACEQSHPSAAKIFSHPTIKLARDMTGSFFLSNNNSATTFPIFSKNYEEAIRSFLKGENLNRITEETHIDKHERLEPETIEQFRDLNSRELAMKKMKELLR